MHCENTASLARCAVRVAPALRSDGRNPDRSQMRGFPAKPRLDGSTGSGPRGDGVGAVSAVAHQKLMAAAVYGVLVGGTVDPQKPRAKQVGRKHYFTQHGYDDLLLRGLAAALFDKKDE